MGMSFVFELRGMLEEIGRTHGLSDTCLSVICRPYAGGPVASTQYLDVPSLEASEGKP